MPRHTALLCSSLTLCILLGVGCPIDDELMAVFDDQQTGKQWSAEVPSSRDHPSAASYCNDFAGADQTDWRLPTIGELRGLLQGCPSTVTGGDCSLSDTCLEFDCCDDPCFTGCGEGAGPDEGCYWPSPFDGNCSQWFWTESYPAGHSNGRWQVNFGNAQLIFGYPEWAGGVLCVRP